MTSKYIWKKNKKYYLWDTYNTWQEALKIAKYYRKKNKSRYFIIRKNTGRIITYYQYELYMDKVMKIF